MPRYFIIKGKCHKKHHEPETHKEEVHHHESSNKKPLKNIPYEQYANELMEGKAFIDYVQTHGLHFTDALADTVTKAMYGEENALVTKRVHEYLKSRKETLPEDITVGDFTFKVNCMMADARKEGLSRDDTYFMERAMKRIHHSPYVGYIFNRWLADVIGMGHEVDWRAAL